MSDEDLQEKCQRLALELLSSEGQCIEEHIWPGHPRYEEIREALQAIVVIAAEMPFGWGAEKRMGNIAAGALKKLGKP